MGVLDELVYVLLAFQIVLVYMVFQVFLQILVVWDQWEVSDQVSEVFLIVRVYMAYLVHILLVFDHLNVLVFEVSDHLNVLVFEVFLVELDQWEVSDQEVWVVRVSYIMLVELNSWIQRMFLQILDQ